MSNLSVELVRVARALVADGDYRYDPKHQSKPSGGWKQTDKGWEKGASKPPRPPKLPGSPHVEDAMRVNQHLANHYGLSNEKHNIMRGEMNFGVQSEYDKQPSGRKSVHQAIGDSIKSVLGSPEHSDNEKAGFAAVSLANDDHVKAKNPRDGLRPSHRKMFNEYLDKFHND